MDTVRDIGRASAYTAGAYDFIYLELNLFCALLMVQIIVRSRDVLKLKYQKYFNRSCAGAIVCCLSDALWVCMLDGFIPMHVPVFLLLKAAYFFAITIMGFFWFVYSEDMISDRYEGKTKQLYLLALPIFAEAVLMVINIFCPILYSFENGMYIRGPLFLSMYAFAYVYVVIAAADALRASFKEENFADKDTLRSYARFPLAPALAGVIQYVKPELPVLCCCIAFIMEYISMKTAESLISIDPLTQLNNRRRFLIKLKETMDGRTPEDQIYVLMIDVDRFKNINDTYGHVEGDAALVAIAEALTRASAGLNHRAVIGRYGGDEFIVLVRETDAQEIRRFCQAINRELDQINGREEKPYTLKISIGTAKFEEEMTMPQFINAADDQLYAVKKEHHAEE